MNLVVALEAYGADLAVESRALRALDADVQLVSTDDESRERQLQDAVGLLVVDHPIDATLLASAPNCRVVATYGIGTDNIDLEAARAAGVIVANVPDYCQDEVADHTIGLWLALERRIVRADAMVRSGAWDEAALVPIRRLRGLVFGLVGFGRIARQVALRARGFGLSVMAYDPMVDRVDAALDFVELATDLEALLKAADIVSLHVPLGPETHRLIDAEAISLMKPSALLINTARGGLTDELALIEALRSGRLAGAALDVYEDEGGATPFHGSDVVNLVLTPHIAFLSTEAVIAAKQGAAEAIVQVLSDDPVRNRVA